MELIEWTVHYLDHVNSFKKNIISKEIKKSQIICQTNSGEIIYYVAEEITKADYPINAVIVTLNSKKILIS